MRLFNKQLKVKEEQQQLLFKQLETTNSRGYTTSYDKNTAASYNSTTISYNTIVLRRTIVRQLVAISSYFYVNFTIGR